MLFVYWRSTGHAIELSAMGQLEQSADGQATVMYKHAQMCLLPCVYWHCVAMCRRNYCKPSSHMFVASWAVCFLWHSNTSDDGILLCSGDQAHDTSTHTHTHVCISSSLWTSANVSERTKATKQCKSTLANLMLHNVPDIGSFTTIDTRNFFLLINIGKLTIDVLERWKSRSFFPIIAAWWANKERWHQLAIDKRACERQNATTRKQSATSSIFPLQIAFHGRSGCFCFLFYFNSDHFNAIHIKCAVPHITSSRLPPNAATAEPKRTLFVPKHTSEIKSIPCNNLFRGVILAINIWKQNVVFMVSEFSLRFVSFGRLMCVCSAVWICA